MSNFEKFTPKKIFDELKEKWKYDTLKTKELLTPEELKQLNILKKIEEKIESLNESTEEKLAKLKEEFSAEEETMIRKAINWEWLNTGIWEIFDEKNYDSLVGSIWSSVSKWKQKLEETIKKWGWKWILAKFSGASKIFSEVSKKEWWGWTGMIAWIIAAWEFFIGSGKKEKKEEKKENEGNEENLKELKFIGVLNILEKISWEKDPKIPAIIKQKKFYRHNFYDIEKNYKAWKDLSAKVFDLENVARDEEVYKSLEFIIKNEKFIDNILKWKDWKNWPLEKVFGEIDKESTILNRLSVMSLDKLKNTNFWFLSIKKDKNWKIEIWWDLKDKLNEKNSIFNSKNISKIDLLRLYDDKTKINFDNKDEFNKTKNRLLWFINSNNEKFIEKFLDFWKKIEKTLIKDFSLWAQQDFSKIFKNKLTTREIIDFYLITWWETDIKKLNSIQKSTMFLKIWKMMWTRWEYSKRWEVYDKKLIDELKNDSSEILSTEVKTLLWNIFLKAAKETFEWLWNMMKEIWSSLDTKTTIAVWVFLVWAWVLTFYTRWLAMRAIISALSIANITLISKMIYDWISDPRIKAKYPQEKIEEWLLQMKKENN